MSILEGAFPVRYFIQEASGMFLEWDTPIDELSLIGQTYYIEGNAGPESLFIGNGVVVDATNLNSGANAIYLQGSFADYSITSYGNGVYLLEGIGDRTEKVEVKYSFSDKTGSSPELENQLVFADGALSLGYLSLRVDGQWQELSDLTLNTNSVTPSYPVQNLGLQGIGETKVFIADANGSKITPFKPGAVVEVQGNAGDDIVYVGNGTVVDATALNSGVNVVYLEGRFGDYDIVSNAGVYTLTGARNGRSEEVSVKYSYSDKTGEAPELETQLYFYDGHISLGYKQLRPDGVWLDLDKTMLASGGTPLAGPIVQSIDVATGTTKIVINLSEIVTGAPDLSDFVLTDGLESTSNIIAINAVSVATNAPQITLSVSDPVTITDELYLRYTPSADFAKQLKGADGAQLYRFSGREINIAADSQPPVISRVEAVDDSVVYAAGDEVLIAVTFSESVNVVDTGGTPRFLLNIGTGNVYANYVSGTGTKVLVFSYTPEAGHVTTDLGSKTGTSIDLNGGTIKDLSGNSAQLTLPTDATKTLLGTSDLKVDAVAPVIKSNTLQVATNLAINAGTKTVKLVTSEIVELAGEGSLQADDFLVKVGGMTNIVASAKLGSDGKSIELTLTDAVVNDADVRVEYSYSVGPQVVDNAGNPLASLQATTVTVVNDTTKAVVQRVVAGSGFDNLTYAAGDPVEIELQFSEAVKVTGIPELLLDASTSAKATYVSGSGSTVLTFEYVVSADDNSIDLNYRSTGSLQLAGGTITDLSGLAVTTTLPGITTANSLKGNSNLIIDGVAPVIDVDTDAENALAKAGSNVVVLTLSESIKDIVLTATDFVVLVNDTASTIESAVIGSDLQTIKLTLGIDVQNDDTVSVAFTSTGTSIEDVNGNVLADFVAKDVVVVQDIVAPRVTNIEALSADGLYGIGDTIQIAVSFDEDVEVTGTPSLSLNLGAPRSALYVEGSGTNQLVFEYTIQSSDISQDLSYTSSSALALNGGSILDLVGNSAIRDLPLVGQAGSISAVSQIVVDGVRPVFTANSDAVVYHSASSGTSEVLLTLSEPVSFTDVSSSGGFTVTMNGADNPVTAVSLAEDEVSLTLSLTDVITPNATIAVGYSAVAESPIEDSAGNSVTTFSGLSVKVSTDSAPEILSVKSASADGAYGIGEVISIEVAFNEVVVVSGTPRLELSLGNGLSRFATYVSGSSSKVLSFSYTVQAGDNSADLGYKAVGALTLNGGAIKDVTGQDAILTLPSPSTEGSLASNSAVVVDTLAPTIDSLQAAAGTNKIVLGLSEVVSAQSSLTVADFTVVVGDQEKLITSVDLSEGSDSLVLTVDHIIQNTDQISVGYVKPSEGVVEDSAANTLNDFTDLGVVITKDQLAPTVVEFFTNTAAGFFKEGDEIDVSVLMSEGIKAGTSMKVQLKGLQAGEDFVELFADGSSVLSGVYIVKASDNETSVEVSSLNPNTVKDLVGNSMVDASLPASKSLTGIVLDTKSPFVKSSIVSDTDSSTTITAGDKLTVEFLEAIANKDEVELFLESDSLFGSSSAAAWVNDTTVEVILGDGTSLVDGQVSTATSIDVQDLAGNITNDLSFIPVI